MVLKLQSWHDFVTETATYKVQSGITKKLHIQEIRFLCSACRPMLVNIPMKVHEDILNSFKVIEQTWFFHRNCYLQSSKRHNSKIYIQELWFFALHVVHCWLIFIWSFKKISRTVFKLQSGHDFVTDRQTDGWTDRRPGQINMSPNPKGRRHNKHMSG